MFPRLAKFLFLLLLSKGLAAPPPDGLLTGEVRTRLAIQKLGVLGSVLMIGAHPDDERADTLAYFARGRLMRAAYLSITRGEGGQNLIGSEQGDLLGVIRSQELLAARRIDGAEQFFTRAIDFGYSKSAQETFEKWGHERILGDVVWVIRKFRPDVVILCFSGTSRDGHGHHQASAILGREAFTAAADPKRFPEQLEFVQPWQAKRLFWNVYGQTSEPGQIQLQTGEFNPVIGYSYAELAGISRSMHHSQGTGMPPRRGTVTSTLVPLAGPPASGDPFDGIDTSWKRLPGGADVVPLLAKAVAAYNPEHPDETVRLLLQARPLIIGLKDPWGRAKRVELDEAVAQCAGLWLDAAADRWAAVPGSTVSVRATALERTHLPVSLVQVGVGSTGERALITPPAYNQAKTVDLTYQVPIDQPYSGPYWLARPHGFNYYELQGGYADTPENEPVAVARFTVRFGEDNRLRDGEIELVRPIHYRYIDRTRGELVRPLAIVPPAAVEVPQGSVIFPNSTPKKIDVSVQSNVENASGKVALALPSGWRAAPDASEYKLADSGEEQTLSFELTPPASPLDGNVRVPGQVGMRVISYPHFPPQVVFPPADFDAVRVDAKVLVHRIGYIMGAGDQVPDALRQLGCEVTLIGPAEVASGDLSRFEAIVTGVRAYNVRADLRANEARLLDYVRNGGTLVVQYNTFDTRTGIGDIGPYPLRLSGARVSVEEAPVAFPDPASPLLHSPNEITESDFAKWIQERGLYFASDWDPRYRTLFESHDPGETQHPGGTLYTKYGKGAYVFTAYSWFRELPAGVPGAYRIFANLLSAGQVLK